MSRVLLLLELVLPSDDLRQQLLADTLLLVSVYFCQTFNHPWLNGRYEAGRIKRQTRIRQDIVCNGA
jgi:hypothetical protein